MAGLFQDFRYGFRSLLSNPGFCVAAVLVLALGISANTTIFSWINATLLDPIPGVSSTGDVVSVMKGNWTASPFPPFSYEDYKDLASRTGSFAGLLGYHDMAMSVTGGVRPERVLGTLASGNYFQVLGVRPVLGRAFLPEEAQKPGTAAVAVIGYGFWQSHFGGQRSILGRQIQINKRPYTVIGVAPSGFQGCKTGLKSDIWIPFTMDQAVTGWRRIFVRDVCWLQLLGRLKPGVDRRQAQEELNLRMQEIVRQHPDSHQGPNQITLDPLWRSPFGLSYGLYTGLSMFSGLAAVLLLLSCANVANLILVRGVGRRRELAIRLSLGASRIQLTRQFLIESLLLSLAAGAAALLATGWTAGSLSTLMPKTPVPVMIGTRLDWKVLLLTLLISLTSSVIVGLLPALRSCRLAPAAVLKEEAGSVSTGLHKSRLARGLVVAQIALSFLLLICAGLFIRSYQQAQRTDPGFERAHMLLASFDLQSVGYSADKGREFDRALISRLEGLPGVQSVTLANSLPLAAAGRHSQDIVAEGYVPRRNESMEVGRVNVGPNYFRTIGIALMAGRDIGPQDNEKSQRVAVINQALADRYWRGQDPIGKRIKAYGDWYTVVGVARNAKYRALKEEYNPMIFLPLFQRYYQDPTLHLRVAGDPYAYTDAVKRIVGQLNGDLSLFDVTSLEEVAERGSAVERLGGTLVGLVGLLALVLAAVGIYGVIAYATRQRKHEIGIRMALGAPPSRVRALVLSQGLRLTLVGLGIGLVTALAVTRSLARMLFGVTPTDVTTYASVALILLLVALAACYFPARRASRVSPLMALREE